MSKSLLRLSSKIFNTPQLITMQGFDPILEYVEKRNGWIEAMLPSPEPNKNQQKQGFDSEEDNQEDDNDDDQPLPISIVDVSDSLTYQPIQGLCGAIGTSYVSLLEQVEEAVEDGAEMIVLNVSSPGGEASHLFEFAEEIRSLCNDNNVRLLAYVDEQATSAAYALSVMCDEVYANPSASIGSIGCVVALVNDSGAMAKQGYKRTYLTSGANKVPFDEDGEFKQSFLDSIQASVDKLNDQFTEFVSKYSGIDTEIIRGFEAAVFDADEALEKGLVTGIMTNSEFVNYITSQFGETND